MLPSLLAQLIDKQINYIDEPTLLFSKQQLRYNYDFFIDTLSAVDLIYYPVKTNNTLAVLNELSNMGSSFEIASLGELKMLKNINISPKSIIYSNPVKIPLHIAKANEYGVNTFAFDSKQEIKKVSENASGASCFLRINVDNNGAEWKLNGKFGVEPNNIPLFYKKALENNLKITCIAFHVGWNNTNIDSWIKALNSIYKVIKENNIKLDFIDIGGGFPTHNIDQYKFLKRLSKSVNPYLKKIKQELGVKIYTEPGSFLVSNAAALITTVVDNIKRGNKNWLYINSGVNQGFYWIYDGIKYNCISNSKPTKKTKKYIITGPSCDSHDVFAKNAVLPYNIKSGDKLIIFPAGAYVSSAKEYNGFGYPENLVL